MFFAQVIDAAIQFIFVKGFLYTYPYLPLWKLIQGWHVVLGPVGHYSVYYRVHAVGVLRGKRGIGRNWSCVVTRVAGLIVWLPVWIVAWVTNWFSKIRNGYLYIQTKFRNINEFQPDYIEQVLCGNTQAQYEISSTESVLNAQRQIKTIHFLVIILKKNIYTKLNLVLCSILHGQQ